jgi:protein subunit release factor A
VANFKDLVGEVAPNLKEDMKKNLEKNFSEQEIAELRRVYNESVKLTDALVSLEALKEQNQVSSEIYDKELEKIQSQFNSQMADIDAKADVLGNVLKDLNTAPDAEARKKAIIKLTKGGKIFADEDDFNKFINGDLTINI